MKKNLTIAVISLFPNMFAAINHGITQRAQEQKRLKLHHFPPQEYTEKPEARVDDRPYGGGPGMVMRYQPLKNAIVAAKQQMPQAVVIHLSPQGKPLTQADLHGLVNHQASLILLCGRYEGIDQRLIDDEVDAEYSIGDYVLSGGELAAMVLIDGLTRLLPGLLGNPLSAVQDSFQQGLLDCPHYTRPECINGKTIPDVLKSGHHQSILDWRARESFIRTWQKRPDMLEKRTLTPLEQQWLDEYEEEKP